MRSGYKLQKDGTIHGLIPTGSKSNKGAERGNSYKVGTSCTNKSCHGGDEQRNVESETATDEISRHGPDTRSDNEAGVFGDTKKGDSLDGKFCAHRGGDDGDGLHP